MDKVLVVDDTREIVTVISTILLENGYEVLVATNWKQALHIAKNACPQCILLDILMPDKNGYEVCSLLRQDLTTAEIPVIFISALSATLDKVKAFQSGGVDYINKPIQFEELLARVKTHITIHKLQNDLHLANTSLENTVLERTRELHSANKKLVEFLAMLEESQMCYRHILESVTDYVYKVKIVNNRPVETEHNSHCIDILGYTPEEFISNDLLWVSIIHPDDKDQVINMITAFLENETSVSIEHRIIHKNGSLLWVSNTLVPFFDKNGFFTMYYGVIRDVSERKMHHQQMMAAIIETEEKERQKFSQELHDGLGPLFSAAKMYIQCLQQTHLEREGQEMAAKTENIINLANNTAREISLNLSPNLLQNYGLEAALRSFLNYISETKNIQVFYVHNSKRIPFILETTLYRVITELVNNTIKHAHASQLHINIEQNSTILSVILRDNGIGFNTLAVNEKRGLGYFNVFNRIESIGGRIHVHSQVGYGVQVTIEMTITD